MTISHLVFQSAVNLLLLTRCRKCIIQFCRSTIAKFPALMSCCTINWFHEWPDDALNFVSNRFLGTYIWLIFPPYWKYSYISTVQTILESNILFVPNTNYYIFYLKCRCKYNFQILENCFNIIVSDNNLTDELK